MEARSHLNKEIPQRKNLCALKSSHFIKEIPQRTPTSCRGTAPYTLRDVIAEWSELKVRVISVRRKDGRWLNITLDNNEGASPPRLARDDALACMRSATPPPTAPVRRCTAQGSRSAFRRCA
mmetsp:Transcript_44294/g.110133  ORF Transcript_44294/g.110133 Transcript_44294/m.110133 type:complete len:122 (+) Transcript_44294:514-879(+)